MARQCSGGLSPDGFGKKAKQQLTNTNLFLGLSPRVTCAICGLTVDAKVIGSEWVPVKHDVPISRVSKGRGTKQSTGKLVIRGKTIPSRFRTGKVHPKRGGRKRTDSKR